MNNSRKVIIRIVKYLAVAVLISAGIFTYIKIKDMSKKIEFTVASKQDVISTIATTGKVTSKTIVSIKSEVSNLIKASAFKEGDLFKQGDVLAEFENTVEAKNVEQAEISLKNALNRIEAIKTKDYPDAVEAALQAELSFKKTQTDFERTKSLSEVGSATPSELDTAKYNYDLALSKLNTAVNSKKSLSPDGVAYKDALTAIEESRIRLDTAKNNLKKTVIIAPFDGIVLKKFFEAGELSGTGKELFTIAKNEEMFVRASVDEKYISKLSLNQKVAVKPQSFDGRSFDGYINRISPSVDNKTGTIDIDITVNNPPTFFKNDMTINVDIITGKIESAIVIDKKYLGGENFNKAWLLRNGKVVIAVVESGKDLGDRIVVTKGIAEGDIVLLKESFKQGTRLSLEKNKG